MYGPNKDILINLDNLIFLRIKETGIALMMHLA